MWRIWTLVSGVAALVPRSQDAAAAEAVVAPALRKAVPPQLLQDRTLRHNKDLHWLPSSARCKGYDPAGREGLSWDDGLQFFVRAAKKCAEAKPTNNEPAVVLTVTNMGYADRFQEMIKEISKLSKVQLVVVALDSETDNWFAAKGIPSIVIDLAARGLQKHEQPGWGIPEAVMRAKLEGTYALLQGGLRVVFMEMDVFLVKDPLSLDSDASVDFYAGSHRYSPEMNIGFYIAKPRPAMIHVFRNLVNWLNRGDRQEMRCEPFDQKLMDCAIRGPHADWGNISSTCGLSLNQMNDIYDSGSKDLKYVSVSNDVVVHVPFKREDYPNIVVGHIWTGSPKESLDEARALGLWQGNDEPNLAATLETRSLLRSSIDEDAEFD